MDTDLFLVDLDEGADPALLFEDGLPKFLIPPPEVPALAPAAQIGWSGTAPAYILDLLKRADDDEVLLQ